MKKLLMILSLLLLTSLLYSQTYMGKAIDQQELNYIMNRKNNIPPKSIPTTGETVTISVKSNNISINQYTYSLVESTKVDTMRKSHIRTIYTALGLQVFVYKKIKPSSPGNSIIMVKYIDNNPKKNFLPSVKEGVYILQ